MSCNLVTPIGVNRLLRKLKLIALLWLCGMQLYGQDLPSDKSLILYVSPTGNDQASATIDQPVQSIAKAVSLARTLHEKLLPNTWVQIKLRGGVYRMKETIALDVRDSYLHISAFENEPVVLSGSVPIAITKVSSSDGIEQVNLKEQGIVDYGNIRRLGFGRPYGTAWGELFVNKKAYHLARYPNTGMLPIKKVIDKGSIPRNKDYSNKGGIFKYSDKRIDAWANEQDPWIAGYFMWGYADDFLPIDTIRVAEKTIQSKGATLYGFGAKEKYRRWYGVNIKAELDTAFEYFVDHKSGDLFFKKHEPIRELELSLLETPFFNVQKAVMLTIKGIVFEQSRGIGITSAETSYFTIEDCIFQNLGGLGVSMGLGVRPFENFKEEEKDVAMPSLVGSLQQHLYTNTLFDRKSGQHNVIRSSIFRYLGAGGVSMGGGDRLSLEPGNNRVENCVFHDNNRIEKSYRAAIHVSGSGNVIAHCEIFNTPSMAILMHGNNHVIEYNYLHDVVLEVNDQGAIYYGRDPSEQGIVVRYNVIENIPDNYLTAAIYHDDGACGLTAYSNVFINAGQRNVLVGGGSNNIYFNNLFVGRKHAVFIDNRLASWLKGLTPRDSGLFAKRLQAVHYQDSTYAMHYPGLVNYFNQLPQPKNNLFHRNVLYNFKIPVFAKKKTMSWRKMALGFSTNNVLMHDAKVFEDLYSKGIASLLAKHQNTVDSIPIDNIGLKNSIFIQTKPSSLGLKRIYADLP